MFREVMRCGIFYLLPLFPQSTISDDAEGDPQQTDQSGEEPRLQIPQSADRCSHWAEIFPSLQNGDNGTTEVCAIGKPSLYEHLHPSYRSHAKMNVKVSCL